VATSREASRKWMRGHPVPGLAKMQVLAKWLDLDLRAIDGGDEITPVREALAGDPDGPDSLDSVPDAVLRRRLSQSIEEIDRPRAELMLTVMLGLIHLSAPGRPQIQQQTGTRNFAADGPTRAVQNAMKW